MGRHKKTETVEPEAQVSQIESWQSIDARIRKTFKAMEQIGGGVVNGHIRSAIISGAPGCGKTYTFESLLKDARAAEKVEFETVKGTMSPIGLYQKLWECNTQGQVLLIDDCDTVFEDLEALNLLKACLDTGVSRTVYWNKESSALAEAGIERSFEFNGAVVFITNTDFVGEIERGSKMSPHYEALLDRSLYVDLGIHTKREVLVRIGQVIATERFLFDNKVSKETVKEMLKWLSDNLAKLHKVSIRSILHLIALTKTSKEDWHDLADVTMLKRNKGSFIV